MKNYKIQIIILFISILLIDATIGTIKNIKREENYEKYLFISYLEYQKYLKGNSIEKNKQTIDKMINNIKNDNFNNIILHVSPFSDSIYPSKILPFSSTISQEEGNYQFDYLDYFLKKSHENNLKLHAWINPYRVLNSNNTNLLSNNNPAKKLLNTTHIFIGNEIYYNPASTLVKDIILSYIKELINNYNIDGILFDDYFYYNSNIDDLEYKNYLKNNKKITKEEYHLKQTNELIKDVYKLIKEHDENIIFTISPDGNINNNYKYHYADIKTWLKENNYIDIIMPQIYYGFDNDYQPFVENYKSWLKLMKNKNIKIIPALAIYKTGTIEKDLKKGKNEWINNNNIIKKQIEYTKNTYSSGYSLFRYEHIYDNNNKITKQEIENIKKII